MASGGEGEVEGGGGGQTGKPERREDGNRNRQDGGEGWGIREKMPTEASNWDRVVELVQTAFGEEMGGLRRIPRGRLWS